MPGLSFVVGAGGGGSGYLAPGLSATSTSANTGDGTVTITYSLAAAVTAPTGVVRPGTVQSASVATLPPNSAFVGTIGAHTVANGVTDANGVASFTFTVPLDVTGPQVLSISVNGVTVGQSAAFTVEAAVTPSPAGGPGPGGGSAVGGSNGTAVVATDSGTTALANTGSHLPGWPAPAAAALVLAGLVLMVMRRTRRA